MRTFSTSASIGDSGATWRGTRFRPPARWAGHRLETAELLALVSRQTDAFVTVDRNLAFQQNVGALSIRVIVLRAPSNRLAVLRRLVPGLLAAIATASPGLVTIVEDI